MQKKKLSLNSLRVQSFITSVKKQEKQTILGQNNEIDLLTEKLGRICFLVKVANLVRSKQPACKPSLDLKNELCTQLLRKAYIKSETPPCLNKS